MKELKGIFKNNFRLYVILAIIILLGTIGVTFSLVISNFRNIAINTTALNIDADISYDSESNGAEIVSNGKMLPILDSNVTGVNVTDSRVLKAKFYVTGKEDNPDNTIYDIALHNIDMDCELRTKYMKWRLYKNGSLLYSGTFSPTFDTIANNRLVLTSTQQDLTMTRDEYVFLMWISETCTGDIASCTSSLDQTSYLNKNVSASIKVELSTKSKKTISRVTGSEGSCSYTEVDIPLCNNIIYDNESHTLVNSNDNYSIEHNEGIKAGNYAVTLKLKDGYKWSNGSTDDKVINCNINRRDVNITTLDQVVEEGYVISSTVNDISVTGLLSGHRIESVTLWADTAYKIAGKISINNVKIVDTEGNDVTDNYNIIKNNIGTVNFSSFGLNAELTLDREEITFTAYDDRIVNYTYVGAGL